jgi:bisphosphoglycerate-dependent phosphoglycerate mutase
MNDELLDEQSYRQLPGNKQTELISKYCHEFGKAIAGTKTLSEAERLAEEQCGKFELLCSSSLIRTAMRKYVHEIINERWKNGDR